MEAAENRASHDLAVLGERMPVTALQRWESRGSFRNPRSEAQMGATLIVMRNPLRQDSAQVFLAQRNRITVMDQETVGMIAGDRFAKLLQGPGCRWMRGDVAMHDAPCPDLHQDEHIESSETGGHHDQEIAGDD